AARRPPLPSPYTTLFRSEYDLLEFLTRHARQVFSRETIFERVWGSDFMGESNVIDVVVMRLREKLEADGESRLIQTVRGVGYTRSEEHTSELQSLRHLVC